MVFTEEAPVDSFVEDSNLSQTVQAQFSGTLLALSNHCTWSSVVVYFAGFSYNGTHLSLAAA